MSSIAYVTDAKMIEYHRLCGNRDIVFWRLSTHKNFKYFRKGDLLFFYARTEYSRKKGFLGYGHYSGMKKMPLQSMWKRYGKANGYDTYEQLQEAVRKAARDGQIPEKMSCLQLTDVVFFRAPVYPSEAGVDIVSNLESYYYLDQNDPGTTARILQLADKVGVDLWSSSQSAERVNVFHKDEMQQRMADICRQIGKDGRSRKEEFQAKKITREFIQNSEFELINGSQTDCYYWDDDQLIIALPYVSQLKNKDARRMEFFGRIALYRLYIEKASMKVDKLRFIQIPSADKQQEFDELLEVINHA